MAASISLRSSASSSTTIAIARANAAAEIAKASTERAREALMAPSGRRVYAVARVVDSPLEHFSKRLADGSFVPAERLLQHDIITGAVTKLESYYTKDGKLQVSKQSYTKEEYARKLRKDAFFSKPSPIEVVRFVQDLEADFNGNMAEEIVTKAQELSRKGLFFHRLDAQAAIQIEHSRVLLRLDSGSLERRIEAVTHDLRKYERVVDKHVKEFARLREKHDALYSQYDALRSQFDAILRQIDEIDSPANAMRRELEQESFDARADALGFMVDFCGKDILDIGNLRMAASRDPEGDAASLLNEYERNQSAFADHSTLYESHGMLAEEINVVHEEITEVSRRLKIKRLQFGIVNDDDAESAIRHAVHRDNVATKAYLNELDLATREHTFLHEGIVHQTSGELSDEIDSDGSYFSNPARNTILRIRKGNVVIARRHLQSSLLHTALPYEGVYSILNAYRDSECFLVELEDECLKHLDVLRADPADTDPQERLEAYEFMLKSFSVIDKLKVWPMD